MTFEDRVPLSPPNPDWPPRGIDKREDRPILVLWAALMGVAAAILCFVLATRC